MATQPTRYYANLDDSPDDPLANQDDEALKVAKLRDAVVQREDEHLMSEEDFASVREQARRFAKERGLKWNVNCGIPKTKRVNSDEMRALSGKGDNAGCQYGDAIYFNRAENIPQVRAHELAHMFAVQCGGSEAEARAFAKFCTGIEG